MYQIQEHFKRIIQTNITTYNKETIRSSSYVIKSLEASFWSFPKQIHMKQLF